MDTLLPLVDKERCDWNKEEKTTDNLVINQQQETQRERESAVC